MKYTEHGDLESTDTCGIEAIDEKGNATRVTVTWTTRRLNALEAENARLKARCDQLERAQREWFRWMKSKIYAENPGNGMQLVLKTILQKLVELTIDPTLTDRRVQEE